MLLPIVYLFYTMADVIANDTSYFLFKKVQLLPSKLSASEFYFTSNNLVFVMRSYRVMWLVLLPAVWSRCETFFLL